MFKIFISFERSLKPGTNYLHVHECHEEFDVRKFDVPDPESVSDIAVSISRSPVSSPLTPTFLIITAIGQLLCIEY